MKRNIIIISIMIAVLAFSQAIYKGGEVRLSPRLMNYQGYLTDTLGNPITNPAVSMTFTIYDAASVGNQKWTETQSAVSISKGIFHVLLGSISTIPDSVFNNPDRWLELSVGGQTLAPRTRIVSAAYAVTSTYADTALYVKNGAPDNDWIRSNGKVYTYNLTDSVGIGTATPAYKLQVLGGVGIGADLYMNNTSILNIRNLDIAQVAGYGLRLYSSDLYAINFGGSGEYSYGPVTAYSIKMNTSGSAGYGWVWGIDGQTPVAALANTGTMQLAGNLYVVDSVGIGTTAPTQHLDVRGNLRLTGALYDVNNQAGTSGQVLSATGTGVDWINAPTDTDWIITGSNMRSGVSGNVGIGRLDPRYKLDVSGVICGGASDTVPATYGAVLGGYGNAAGDDALDSCATVAGGFGNLAGDKAAFVGGGQYDTASGIYSSVVGGYDNLASGYAAIVGGGALNTASGTYSSLTGGYINAATGRNSFIGGGTQNYVNGANGFCGAGANDTVMARGGAVVAGSANKAGDAVTDTGATVCGGYGNKALDIYSFVGGGGMNVATSPYSMVGGGFENRTDSAEYLGNFATIGGGTYNKAYAQGTTIAGGSDNSARYMFATVGGGLGNKSAGAYATVCGGYANSVKGDYSFIGGGSHNQIEYYSNAAVVSGNYNLAQGGGAFIGSGAHNGVFGSYTTIPGGASDSVLAYCGFATNYHSKVQASDSNSAAFTSSHTIADNQIRAASFSTGTLDFAMDHPDDPMDKILNQYGVSSDEVQSQYSGSAILGDDGCATVNLPDYFDDINRNPRIQLTGVGSPDVVYVAEKIKSNRFVIAGKPGMEVYWEVTAERKDIQAEIARVQTPVVQEKTGDLRGHSIDDDAMIGIYDALYAKNPELFQFKTAEGRGVHEQAMRLIEENEIK